MSYNCEAFKDTYRVIYYSKISVGFIAAGYFFAVFGDVGDGNKWIIAISILFLTCFLIIIAKFAVESFANKASMQITNEELDDAGIRADIETTSSQEIEEMFGE